MAEIAASVLARLKSRAAESGRSYQLCLQLFCQEEFLRRLEKSKYSENLVLKGGLFIYSLTDFDSRVTVDVDFLLRQIPNTPEQLKTVLEEIIATPTGNDFITFEITDIAPIAVAKKYAGIGASVIARIKNTRTPFSIDFGVGDVIINSFDTFDNRRISNGPVESVNSRIKLIKTSGNGYSNFERFRKRVLYSLNSDSSIKF